MGNLISGEEQNEQPYKLTKDQYNEYQKYLQAKNRVVTRKNKTNSNSQNLQSKNSQDVNLQQNRFVNNRILGMNTSNKNNGYTHQNDFFTKSAQFTYF